MKWKTAAEAKSVANLKNEKDRVEEMKLALRYLNEEVVEKVNQASKEGKLFHIIDFPIFFKISLADLRLVCDEAIPPDYRFTLFDRSKLGLFTLKIEWD
jgi:hypothetical protein